MPLPKHFVKTNLKKVKGAHIFGVPFEQLSRDELLAVAVAGWAAESNIRKENLRRLDLISTRMEN